MKRIFLSYSMLIKYPVICLVLACGIHVRGQTWAPSGGNLTFAGGNVAIGTTTATGNRLTVQGASGLWNLRLSNAEAGGSDWLVGSSSNLWDAGGGKFVITNTGSSSNPAILINASRNVGIGKVDPTYKLDVDGAINGTAIYAGVTTAPAGYKLAVGGKAVAEEMVVKLQANWPDYVFEDSYKLPSLLEVDRYIRENKHLPEVPSAADVAEQGLSLGEMNAVLLKKVEELTLYMIELKKEVETLKAANHK